MFKVGQLIALKQFGRLIKAVVVSVDTDFISVVIKYNREKGTILKVRKDDKDLINLDFTTKEVHKAIDTEAFISKNNLA